LYREDILYTLYEAVFVKVRIAHKNTPVEMRGIAPLYYLPLRPLS